MAVFKPQTEAPSTTDKNYIHYTKGGYNYCIEIKNGSCLSNCVGYAWGRWRCLLGKYHNLSRANAENWWGYTKDGYKRGQTPKLGAVVCWSKGKVGVESDGAGHVGIVEKITDDSVVVSMSAYGGTRWFTRTFKKGSYNYNGFAFQGFIYPPIEFEEEKPVVVKPATSQSSTSTSATATKKKVATNYAQSKSSSLDGTYKTTDYLNIRNGAGTNHNIMVTVPPSTKVRCYGYYTSVKNIKWLYIQFDYKGVEYTGFASSEYLKKQ